MRCDETLRGTERISAELVGVHCQTTGLWLVGLKGHLAGSMICFKAARTDVPFSSATFLDAIYYGLLARTSENIKTRERLLIPRLILHAPRSDER
jgi:hypothetical protein